MVEIWAEEANEAALPRAWILGTVYDVDDVTSIPYKVSQQF